MRVFRLPLFVGLVLLSTAASAQVFGGNPPSLKWHQLNTDTARIIFPMGLDSQAQRVAAIVHQLSQTTLFTIGHTQRKINIVLQNQTTIANGLQRCILTAQLNENSTTDPSGTAYRAAVRACVNK